MLGSGLITSNCSRSDADGCEEIDCETIVSGGDATEVLQATEHALDGVAVSMEDGREAILPASVRLGRDVRHRALSLDLSVDGIAVITLVAVQDRGTRWHLFEQNRL